MEYWRWLRSTVYDTAIVWFTAEWYKRVLERIPVNSLVLDVGIGTATALLKNKSLLDERRLRVIGVDIDGDYVARAQQLIASHNAAGQVEVHEQSIYDYSGGPFDAIYFSGSFMLMPDPEGALRHTMSMLRPGGLIFFTQTFATKQSALLEYVKPMLAYITTIDFGQVTYFEKFSETLTNAGVIILANELIHSTPNGDQRLIIAARAGDPN